MSEPRLRIVPPAPPPGSLEEPLLKPAQVATLLAVSPRTVYQLAERRELDHVRLGTAIRFRPAAVRAYIERCAVPAEC